MNIDFIPLDNPWDLFAKWLEAAKHSEPAYPDAMILATVGADGMPTARTVLMKDFDQQGIVFYTNRESRKGNELAVHAEAVPPKAGLCFYWKSLQRQVRIEGTVEKVSDAESDAYFASRPRGSQIGAWASQQSRPLADRQTLEQRVRDLTAQYEGRNVPRPVYWGGYRLVPTYFEFWQERDFRLHDRITYGRQGDAWVSGRLYP